MYKRNVCKTHRVTPHDTSECNYSEKQLEKLNKVEIIKNFKPKNNQENLNYVNFGDEAISECPEISVLIDTKQYRAQLDTGSRNNFMSTAIASQLKLETKEIFYQLMSNFTIRAQ